MIHPFSICLLATLLVPPFVYTAFSASSMTLGLVLSSSLWIGAGLTAGNAYVIRRSDAFRIAGCLLLIALFSMHLSLSVLQVDGVTYTHFLGSCLVLMVLSIGALFAARLFASLSARELKRTSSIILGILTSLGVAAMLGAPGLGTQATAKPVVIFSEPSHFSLVYLPMLLFRSALAGRRSQALLLAGGMLLGVGLESLTLLAGVLMISAALLRGWTLMVLSGAFLAVLFTADLTYYTARLALSAESSNLSALVFLQGWETAAINFAETTGIGVGFQQFGIAGSVGAIAHRVADIAGGTFLNLRDGGSTATKLIGEFGMLGIVAVLLLSIYALIACRQLRKAQKLPPHERNCHSIFVRCLIITYMIELFIRGVGYFSIGGFLVAFALLSLNRGEHGSAAPNVLTKDPST